MQELFSKEEKQSIIIEVQVFRTRRKKLILSVWTNKNRNQSKLLKLYELTYKFYVVKYYAL
jgi:hypothetical protein